MGMECNLDIIYGGAYANLSPKEKRSTPWKFPLRLSKIIVEEIITRNICTRPEMFYPEDDVGGGDNFFHKLYEVQKKSSFTIVIVNPHFLQSGWNRYMTQSIFLKKIEDNPDRVFFVAIGDITKEIIAEKLGGIVDVNSINFFDNIGTDDSGEDVLYDREGMDELLRSIGDKVQRYKVQPEPSAPNQVGSTVTVSVAEAPNQVGSTVTVSVAEGGRPNAYGAGVSRQGSQQIGATPIPEDAPFKGDFLFNDAKKIDENDEYALKNADTYAKNSDSATFNMEMQVTPQTQIEPPPTYEETMSEKTECGNTSKSEEFVIIQMVKNHPWKASFIIVGVVSGVLAIGYVFKK